MSAASDPFRLLGLEPRFELDLADLERRQRELTLERRAEGASALQRLNDAVRELKDPVTRAERLLELQGCSTQASASADILEWAFVERERIETWRRHRDVDALHRWLRDVAMPQQRELLERLQQSLDVEPEPERAVRVLVQMRYAAKAATAARAALDALEE